MMLQNERPIPKNGDRSRNDRTQRLRLDESNEKYDAPSLTHEEITRRMVAILDSWLIQKAKELGEPEPTVEERAKLIVEFIDLKKNRGAQDIAC